MRKIGIRSTGYGNSSSYYGVLVPTTDQTNYTYASKAIADGTLTQAEVRELYFEGTLTTAKWDPKRGDAIFNFDARLSRDFTFKNRIKLQIISQAFDITNRANYGNDYAKNIGSGSYGHAVGWVNPSNSITPRALTGEFGFRLSF